MLKIYKLLLIFELIILFGFLMISLISYLNVLGEFGEVPSSNDYTYFLETRTGKEFIIFPEEIGFYLCLIFMWVILLVFIQFILAIIFKLLFPKKEGCFGFHIFLLGFTLLSYVLLLTKPFGWYFGYVLD